MSLVPTPAGESFDMEASSSEDDCFETPATQKFKTQKPAVSTATETSGRSTPSISPTLAKGKQSTPTKPNEKRSKKAKTTKGLVGSLGDFDSTQGTPFVSGSI